jgi:tagatose-1,6-bisphosphate aldolase
MSTFTARDVTHTVWAYATAGVDAPLFFGAVAGHAINFAPKFNSHELANLVWAFASSGVAAPALFEATVKAASAVGKRASAGRRQTRKGTVETA